MTSLISCYFPDPSGSCIRCDVARWSDLASPWKVSRIPDWKQMENLVCQKSCQAVIKKRKKEKNKRCLKACEILNLTQHVYTFLVMIFNEITTSFDSLSVAVVVQVVVVGVYPLKTLYSCNSRAWQSTLNLKLIMHRIYPKNFCRLLLNRKYHY